jgi:hypothetical protein
VAGTFACYTRRYGNQSLIRDSRMKQSAKRTRISGMLYAICKDGLSCKPPTLRAIATRHHLPRQQETTPINHPLVSNHPPSLLPLYFFKKIRSLTKSVLTSNTRTQRNVPLKLPLLLHPRMDRNPSKENAAPIPHNHHPPSQSSPMNFPPRQHPREEENGQE